MCKRSEVTIQPDALPFPLSSDVPAATERTVFSLSARFEHFGSPRILRTRALSSAASPSVLFLRHPLSPSRRCSASPRLAIHHRRNSSHHGAKDTQAEEQESVPVSSRKNDGLYRVTGVPRGVRVSTLLRLNDYSGTYLIAKFTHDEQIANNTTSSPAIYDP